MRKEKWIKWLVGGGIGFVILGIAVFAQRGSDIFSFERFRAPQFLLRDPSSEDRPVVEVVSSPVTEKANEPALSPEGEEAPVGGSPFRLQSDLATRPVMGAGARWLPPRLAADSFRDADWQMQNWVPFYRDRQAMGLRAPAAVLVEAPPAPPAAPIKEKRATEFPPQNDLWSQDSRSLPPERERNEVQAVPALSFSDRSNESLGLRPMESRPIESLGVPRQNLASNPPALLAFRESPMGLRDRPGSGTNTEIISGDWAMAGTRSGDRSLIPEGSKFKGRDVENYESDDEKSKSKENGTKEGEKSLAKSSEEESAEALAKQNQEVKDLDKRSLEDRRFQAVAEKDLLYSEDGRARMYAPGFRIGRFDVNMDISNRLSYNDNYALDKRGGATVLSTTPTIEVAGGERDPEITDALYAAFRYTPSLMNFLYIDRAKNLSPTQKDDPKSFANHDAAFNAGYRFSKLSVLFDQRLSRYSGADVEVGGYTTRNFYTTSGSAEYELSEKTSLEVAGNLALKDYQTGFDSDELKLRSYVNYSMSEKVRLGLGGAAGTLQTKGGPEQVYYQSLMRGVYFVTPKSTLFGETGLEQRQFSGTGAIGDKYDFVFRGGGSLALFPRTTIELDTSRRQIASGSIFGQNLKITGFSATLVQDVEKLRLSVGGGVDLVDYVQTTENFVSQNKQDQSLTFKLGGRYPLMEWWDFGLDYTYRKNNSDGGLDYEANEVGVNSKVRF